MIRNIIFDWSGTLVNDLPAVLEASNYVFLRAGVPTMTMEEFRREFCLPFTKFYERYVPHIPIPQLEEWFHHAFRLYRHMIEEIPHARQFLEFSRERGFKTFLLSSVHRDHYAEQAAATGFDCYFDHVFVEVLDKRTKMRSLVSDHGLVPAETMFVGDMAHDVEAARAGGVYACAVLTGYNHADQLYACQPDLVVQHLGELKELMAREDFPLQGSTRGLNRSI
ncbi:MAG: HAD family hydrolase [Verrucomicrobiae bacterium]|nr:HAD family hydrolase [Verrucomicrobiae bacterium]